MSQDQYDTDRVPCSDCRTSADRGKLYWCYWCSALICPDCVRFADIGMNTRASMCKACHRRHVAHHN